MQKLPHVICVCACAAMLASCAALKDGGDGTGFGFATRAKLPDLAETPLARLLPAGGLKVVEVREEDLRKMPSGADKALAYRNERRGGFRFFGGPIHFEEPPLPDIGGELDGSLLPPRTF